jgi:hypothetical protein
MSTTSAVKAPTGSTVASADAPPPHKIVVVNIGKKKRKQVSKLIKGQGKLMTQVTDLVANLETSGQIAAGSSSVVVVVEKKKKSTSPARRYY